MSGTRYRDEETAGEMKLSIVTTMYYSAPYVEDFYRKVSAEASKITDRYEIIFVNDGSPDDSLAKAVQLHNRDSRVKVIDLSRNFGHHKAAITGLEHARGDVVLFMDCDLEVPPEVLSPMYQELLHSDADTVFGVQKTRKGKLFERISGAAFYWLFNRLSSYPVHPNLAGIRLMRRPYLDGLLMHKESTVFLAGLCAITGFKQVPVFVEKSHKGHSTYNLSRKIDLLITAVTSFSDKPLTGVFYLGMAITLLSMIGAFLLLLGHQLAAVRVAGWHLALLSIWFLGGIILACIGIVGIYVGKILMETKRRPYTVIARIYDVDPEKEIPLNTAAGR